MNDTSLNKKENPPGEPVQLHGGLLLYCFSWGGNESETTFLKQARYKKWLFFKNSYVF